MKHASQLATLLIALLVLAACGPAKDRARFEGRLTNITNAEFYAYTDDGTGGIDTIRITDGEFTYERQLDHPLLLTLLYPNFTQTYVVLEPGKTVKMKGDASKIGEAAITGTPENELLTDFRQRMAASAGRNARIAAADFVRGHATTLSAVAVFKKHFQHDHDADPRQCLSLLDELHRAQPSSAVVRQMEASLRPMLQCGKGQQLPALTATATDGRQVNLGSRTGKPVVVVFCASWRGQSLVFLRQARQMLREPGIPAADCIVLSADLDARNCTEAMKRDSITWPVVCDGQAFRSPMVTRLGLSRVPSCVVADAQGRITARDIITPEALRTALKALKH